MKELEMEQFEAVKEAYSHDYEEFIDEIKRAGLVKEVKPEVGVWFKDEYGIFMVTSIDSDGYAYGYGVTCGVWEDLTDELGHVICDKNTVIQKATIEEVKEMIREQIDIKGFKHGVRFRSVSRHITKVFRGLDFDDFTDTYNWIVYSNEEDVFESGKFAEIIEEKPRFEVGKCYASLTHKGSFFICDRIEDRGCYGDGCDFNGCVWMDVSWALNDRYIEATDDQRLYLEALLKRESLNKEISKIKSRI